MKIILPSSLMICFSAILFFVLVPKQNNDFSKLWKESGLDFSTTHFDNISQRAIASFDGYQYEFYKKPNSLSGYDINVDRCTKLSDVKVPLLQGAQAQITDDGNLVIVNNDKKITHSKPIAYQVIEGDLAWVDVDFNVSSTGNVSFKSTHYNPEYELTIDPAFTSQNASALADPAVLFKDLRNIECYAQPENIVVCGLGDTIPIMLFTKSVDPIYDVELTLDFGPGLEYGAFAYVQSDNADLDTIDVITNRSSPTFRISEISQAAGGVVVYIAVRAKCGVDFSLTNPSVTFNLNYTANGTPCSSSETPEQPYGSNVINPEPRFVPPSTPATAMITNLNTNTCITTGVTNITPGGGMTQGYFTVDNYGFAAGVALSTITVNGVAVPAAAITTDPTTGKATVYLDGQATPTYWGADGQLTSTETINIVTCFQAEECVQVVTNPNFTIQSACEGQVCNPSIDVISLSTLRNGFAFNPVPVFTGTNIAAPSFCDPITLEPTPYILEVTLTSSIATPIRGDLYNLRYFIDACPTTYLSVDTVYMMTAAGGTPIPGGGLPKSVLTQTSAGRIIVDFRALPDGLDLDGAGGLVDLDGEGKFDDIAAGTSITFRIELLPSCSAATLSCPTSATPVSCDITRHFFQGYRNCNPASTFSNGGNINDGIDAYSNTSMASWKDTTTITVNSGTYSGYHFGIAPGGGIGQTTNETLTTPRFEYTMNAGDFNTCPTPGLTYYTMTYFGYKPSVVNFEISNVANDGNPVPLVSDVLDTTATSQLANRVLVFGPIDIAAGLHDITFDLKTDTFACAGRQYIDLGGFVTTECDGCNCSLSRACSYAVVSVDPASGALNCNTNTSFTRARRITTGYTDCTLATRVDTAAVPAADKLRFLPGDTMEITGYAIITNADLFNEIDRVINIDIRQSNALSANANHLLTHRLAFEHSRVQSLTLNRGTTSIDIGNLSLSGNYLANTNENSGLSSQNVSTAAGLDPTQVHPGLSDPQWVFNSTRNEASDINDNFRHWLRIFSDFAEGDQDALSALRTKIGGAFQNNDTIIMTFRVPVMSKPDVNALFGSTVFQPVEQDSSYILMELSGNKWGDKATYSGFENVTGSSPKFGTVIHYRDPNVESNPYIDFTDSCSPKLVQAFKITNTIPDDWFTTEYRPIIGIERFSVNIPKPYFTCGDITYDHCGTSSVLQPDSVSGMKTISTASGTSYYPTGSTGKLWFWDPEFADGLRPALFEKMDAGLNDITLVSGSNYPLLGVGKGTSVAMPDSLVFSIPLQRGCGTAVQSLPLTTTYSASYPFLFDFNSSSYTCNNGFYYNGGIGISGSCTGMPARYWPWDRLSKYNPHRLAVDSVRTAAQIGATPATYTYTTTLTNPGPIIDGLGPESNTANIAISGTAPAGIAIITVEDAVNVISIGGATPVAAGSTDTTRSYVYDLGTGLSGTIPLEIVTDLNYCGPSGICIDVLLGCNNDAAKVAEVLSKSCETCGPKVCYNYLAGLPELETRFTFPNNLQLCEEATYEIAYINTGSSDLGAFFPTVYLPPGFEFTPGMWMWNLAGDTPAAVTDPTENASKTGVYGTAYEFASTTTFAPGIPKGRTLILTFKGRTTCNSILGMPIVTEANTSAACSNMFETEPDKSDPINVGAGNTSVPSFKFDPEQSNITCTGGTDVTVTMLNVGKAPLSRGIVCLRLPGGITITPADIEVVAPAGGMITNFTSAALGSGGATNVCFDAPATAQGGFFCFKLKLAGDLACGDYEIALQVIREQTLTCPGDPNSPCEVKTVSSENQFFKVTVVPAVNATVSDVVASCSANAGKVNIDYTLNYENLGTNPYVGDATVELYYDIDKNNELGVDDVLLTSGTQALNLSGSGMLEVMGTFEVAADSACPLIIRVAIPGCACGEVIVPVPELKPDFIADLGDVLTLCPGEPYVINGVCGTYSVAVEPAAAATAVVIAAGSAIRVEMTPGYVGSAVLKVSSTLGQCTPCDAEIKLQQLSTFAVADQDIVLCSDRCQLIDLGIDPSLWADLGVTIVPNIFIDTITGEGVKICNPTSAQSYTITYSLNGGQCTTTSKLNMTIQNPPTITIMSTTGCNGGIALGGIATITPSTLDGLWSSAGDGTFVSSSVYSTATMYIPGQLDKQTGSVLLTLRTDNPDGPCGGVVARETFRVILTDCGTFPWNGGTSAPPVAPDQKKTIKNK